ncbi:hypothetical protein CAPI_09230 [Corynebacterium capitovis DSM 44611]|uniref:hypothetical protein n=1 Tax=Corynebacterium capitovis TaxID=131081 RepID=UPI00036938AC|nr:hypothetical protein [Corynebacterium capitovis]WKD58369.1 hypothetical protein CAPI_09230 [Corynebacterium capitovis DSM 44611]
MSTPYNGGAGSPNGRDWHPENEPTMPAPGGADGAYGTYGAYGAGYGQQSYAPGAFDVNAAAAGRGALRHHGIQLVDGTYGDGFTPHPINDPAHNGWAHVKGTGKMNAIEAWTFGFRTTLSNWKFWVPAGLIIIVVGALSGVAPVALSWVASLTMLLIAPVVYSVALMGTLSRSLTFNEIKVPAYGKTLGMLLFLGIIITLIFSAVSFVALMVGGSQSSAFDDPTVWASDEAALEATLPVLLGVIAATLLFGFLIGPFFSFQALYASDNAGSFGDALREGFRAGARNYLQILAFSLLSFVAFLLGMVLFGVGLLIVMPAYLLAIAYAYRQISGGPVPVTT